MNVGVQLVVKTEKETISGASGTGVVCGAPDVKIVKGDTVEIKGARINFNDKPAIIAAEIKKGEAV